jgi:hypothetical protein
MLPAALEAQDTVRIVPLDTVAERPFRGVVDTEESLWPDPRIRTNVRVSSLQALIENHERRHGSLPASLSEILPAGPGPLSMDRDVWGNLIEYTVSAGEYEVRAPGPDGVPGTADDIVARRGTELPVREAPVFAWRTTTIMGSLNTRVLEHRHRHGGLPESLECLSTSGLWPYLGTTHEWGTPIRYSRQESGFELRSAGPDATFQTADDLVLAVPLQ